MRRVLKKSFLGALAMCLAVPCLAETSVPVAERDADILIVQRRNKLLVEDLSDKKIGVILGNNGFKTMLESMKKAVNENYYAIITNQVYLLGLECFIDSDGLRDIYIASLKNNRPLTYIEDYLEKQINREDNLEMIYRNRASK